MEGSKRDVEVTFWANSSAVFAVSSCVDSSDTFLGSIKEVV